MRNELRCFTLAVFGIFVTFRSAEAQTTVHLALQEAVQLALQHSPMLKQGVANVEAAKAHVAETESYAMPQLAGDAVYTRIDPTLSVSLPGSSQSFSFQPHDNYQAGLNLQEVIYAFGRERANLDVAESGQKAAEDNLDAFRMNVAVQTLQTYYALLGTYEGIRVEQDQLKVLQDNLAIAEAREKAGTTLALEPLSVHVRIAELTNHIADLNATQQKQISMMRRLTGVKLDQQIAVVSPPAPPALPEQIDSLLEIATHQRPELTLALDAERTAKLQIDVARTNDNPVLAANISGGVKDGYPPNLTDPKLNWAGSLSFHIPILDGGKTKAQTEAAEATYRAAVAKTEEVRESIQNDIEQTLTDVTSTRGRVARSAVQIEQAQQAYDVAVVRYKNGAATNLDVLTAQSALEQAQLEKVQYGLSYELSLYNLNRAVGTKLW